MRISAVIPTRNRPAELAQTLHQLGEIPASAGVREIVIVDNASSPPTDIPAALANGTRIELIRLDENLGAAARNEAARAASGDWLMMLDDDSAPTHGQFIEAARDALIDVHAIGAEIFLSGGGHEAGGLPEVFVGCGALIRRDAFLAVGGYDAELGYYGEETDLCARLIARGGRITHDRRFRVLHRRAAIGRNIGRIIEQLARNEPLIMHRYAPQTERDVWIDRTLDRRRSIAQREKVTDAFSRGLSAFRRIAADTEPRPLSQSQWDRLIGVEFARAFIRDCLSGPAAVRMPSDVPGKHREVITHSLQQAGLLLERDEHAAYVIAGTLAPGLALDAATALQMRHQDAEVFALSPFGSE